MDTLDQRLSEPQPRHQRATAIYDHQAEITSLALQWLIENCENPSSLAIALQAIAGASSKHPREPLNECNAALKILQRLVTRHSEEREVQRYTRALQFLGHGSALGETLQNSTYAGELEVMIWELQSSNETYVSDLITDGGFVANEPQNIDALQLGNMAAVHSLELLKKGGIPDAKILHQITSTIQRQLHPAASVSLIYAATLISATSLRYPSNVGQVITHSCMNLLLQSSAVPASSKSLSAWVRIQPLICVLALGQPEVETSSRRISRIDGVVRVLHETTSMNQEDIDQFLSAGAVEVLSKPDYYFVGTLFARAIEPDRPFLGERSYEHNDTGAHAMKLVYRVTQTNHPALPNYLMIVRFLCGATGSEQDELSELISRFRFPRLSGELVALLRKHDLISHLRYHSYSRYGYSTPAWSLGNRDRYNRRGMDPALFSKTVLWLFGALLGDRDPSRYTHDEQVLQDMLSWETQESGAIRRRDLETLILDPCHGMIEQGDSPSIYLCRIVECIFQRRDYSVVPKYHPLMDYVGKRLETVPPELRRLNSFTSPSIWRDNLQPGQPPRPSDVAINISPNHHRRDRRTARAEPAPRMR